MKTVRRLYFYAVSLISLEVVLWGLIGLVRSIINPNIVGSSASRLAQALSLILVGVPVFLIHWSTAQRNSRESMEEQSSGIRAFFLYASLAFTLFPVVQNGFRLVNQLILILLKMSPQLTMLNRGQNWSDNLVAILMNGIIAYYFIRIVGRDWETVKPDDELSNKRRIYRYAWVIYSLVMVVAGVQQIIQYIMTPYQSTVKVSSTVLFSNSITLLLVGAPLFYFSWRTVQRSLTEPRERASLLRLGIFYVLSLAGVITVLSSGGFVLKTILEIVLGYRTTTTDFLNGIKIPLSLGISLGGVWAYFGYWLNQSITQVPDAPRRSGLKRFYFYILSAIGLVATFIGVGMLLSFIIDSITGFSAWETALRPSLASALAVVFVSLPLWWLTWKPMQLEALTDDDDGDHARRSLMRRIYLFAVLFACVIGGMVTTGSTLYILLRKILGDNPFNFLQNLLNDLQLLVLFILVGYYHGITLRNDGKKAAETLEKLHVDFPVLIIDPGNSETIKAIIAEIDKQLPKLNIATQQVDQSMAGISPDSYKAVLLPGNLALDPPNAIAKWLTKFDGTKIITTTTDANWELIGADALSPEKIAKRAVQLLRQLAEGQEINRQAGPSGWLIAFYIILGLILTPTLISIIANLF
jgi:hypothetical protein